MNTLNNSVRDYFVISDIPIWRIICDSVDDDSFNEINETILIPLDNLIGDSIKNTLMRFSECYLHGYFDERFDAYFE